MPNSKPKTLPCGTYIADTTRLGNPKPEHRKSQWQFHNADGPILNSAGVRILRTHLGLTHQKFADLLDVHISTSKRWVMGTRPVGQKSLRKMRVLILRGGE